MITLTPIPTAKELFKNLYRLVRSNCSMYEHLSGKIVPPQPKIRTQQFISNLIQEYTREVIPSSYSTSFAKQLRVYMYAYRHHRLGGVSSV